ncbi:hypothetical protein [Chengkuizengella sediminis]|uniref:hypothetical protein n=1 Tax=Chengkuizengella sediminis TaxID=1885917 RepID=UPI0013895574|nr:hypothetical protein [Chengkuizengella sediminis]NDI36873.1 hypothetical protein [Chengkuizengella sediminis]
MMNKHYYNLLLSLKYGLLIVWIISISFISAEKMAVGVLSLLLAVIYGLVVINLIKKNTLNRSKTLIILVLQTLITIILLTFGLWSILTNLI